VNPRDGLGPLSEAKSTGLVGVAQKRGVTRRAGIGVIKGLVDHEVRGGRGGEERRAGKVSDAKRVLFMFMFQMSQVFRGCVFNRVGTV